ncbi:MAG: cytochrome c family protein [Sphingomonadales bacterium 35-56-22]|jgi:cytochrome c|uniref:c-type cytochrome n=1 Tax=Sphingorhabdus sp. TaxID=1902408 RepID=UPI000BD3B4C5|nr:cytochrome c family protein [Sphingorhabdus sp.]OYY16891.1 MAG: cytochrome c family protein [Sphingomonadales bacterium 35-56-22]OYY99043.1 MAG: cytochrome c family protein [Sphingomonadales bacterium 28-56-43]OYZ61560.1 MAG: cytochrome c family protein [Sphingomonadales bacterium 24-56-14]OZA83401.1 MAG: cytochrome c family protein [Sphingomonadales bacterium 39-57-19]HQS12320.1 cytochrome c family protein [Sphingorhabdus sp.]
MDDRSNTIAGWVLAGGIVALGLSIVSGMYFHGEAPEKEGFAVAAEAGGEAGGAAAVPIATLLATADIAKGEAVFKKCAACHTIAQGGPNGIGPNLWAAMGKPHGHVAGFSYSDALKSVPGNWDFEGMDKWLANPKKYAPGTKMTFAGLGNPEERANLIAYLNAQGSNLPLPPPPAADAAAPAADAATGEAAAAPAADAAAPAAPAAK